MQVTVEYNQDSFDYFFSPVFVEFPDLKQTLVDDFIIYKSTGTLPSYFGRDTSYHRPPDIEDAGLMHLHLAIGENKFEPIKMAQISAHRKSCSGIKHPIPLSFMHKIFLMRTGIH